MTDTMSMTELEQCSKLVPIESMIESPPGCVSYPGDGNSSPRTDQEQPANSDLSESSLNHCMEPSSTGNGVVVKVTVTHHPLDRPLSSSSLQPSSDKTTSSDPFDSEKGLSCLSLEVMTSGEHLNTLSLEDLSSHDSGQDSAPEFASSEGEQEGEGLNLCAAEDGKGEELERECGQERASVDEELGVLEERAQDPPKDVTAIVEATCQTPSEDSRCSSSMGYLEPRPSNRLPSNGDKEVPSPKEIQRKLMEKVSNLHPDDHMEKEGQVMEAEPVATPTSTISSSHSSHSLNSSGSVSSKGISFGSIFKRRRSLFSSRSGDHKPQTLAATSTTGLILHDRPKTLPAKTPAEEHRHQRLHQQMLAAARKKELQKAKEEVKKEKMRRERDKLVADSLVEWEKVLLKWESLHNTRKIRELWWQGLPPGVRGKVWRKAIGNDLNISSDLYVINLRRCKERLASARERSDSSTSRSSVSREQSVEVIHLDVLRTFPTLGFFQEGGPYNQALRDILGAYACYRPDIGYVQGMSFLAGVLLLNMDAGDAFISLANLLNRPSYLAFFKVDHTLMRPYFNTFDALLQTYLSKLSAHFVELSFSPEYYLIEWIFTIYTRVLPLDVACRVWDMFCRDDDSFLFRTALGILKLCQSSLLELRSIEDIGQFLGNLPGQMESDALFAQIDSVHLTSKHFKQVLSQQQSKLSDSDSVIC